MAMSSYIRALRAHVGTDRLLVPSVAGIVRDAESRVLLVQQRDDGTWSTPGGAIEMDETPADAVVREVWEETGLLVTPRRLIAVYGGPAFVVRYPNGDETQYISAMFECDVQSGHLHADDDEVQAARFWSLDDARALQLSAWLPPVLARLYGPDAPTWFEPPSWRP
jgi:8-oxo-dGTP pyrophosphatase MutT (NUDIX family)